MDLNEAVVFIKVVQKGSFTKAAQELGMPVSTVSEKVTSLERRLGATLIQRTTRKLSITPVGQAYFKRCIVGLEEFKAADSEVIASRAEPQGLLRITAPIEFGVDILPPLVANYTKKYPKTEVETLLTQRKVDFLNDEVDAAIRVGKLNDSSLIARKVGTFSFVPMASPEYLKLYETPKHPKDLVKHTCLAFTPLDSKVWNLSDGQKNVKIEVHPRLRADETEIHKGLVMQGMGIGLIPSFCTGKEVRDGRLVRVLPNWYSGIVPVHIVYPSQRFMNANLSAFLKLAIEYLQKRFDTR